MEKKNSLFKNIIYAWKLFKKYKVSKMYYASIFLIFLLIVTPFLTMALPSVAIWLLINEIYFTKTLLIIFSYALLLIVLNFFIQQMNLNSMHYNAYLRLSLGMEIDYKILDTDFINIDNQTNKNKIEKALVAVYQNHDIGFPALTEGSRIFIVNIICLIIYLLISAKLNILIMILLIISPIFSLYASNKNIKWLEKNKDNWVKYDKKIRYLKTQTTDLKNGKDIRLYKIQHWFVDLYYNLVNSRVSWYDKEYRRIFLIQLLDRIVFCVQSIIVYGYLLYKVTNGMDIATFTLYLGVVSGISTFIKTAFDKYAYMQKNNVSVNDYLSYIHTPDISNRDEGEEIPKCNTYEIRFENVSFKYPDTDKYLFENLNLTIKKGEKLALVGANGAGKTTFIKLLCGLYTPDNGDIYINDINIKDINIKKYYNLFSVAFQEVFAFAFTIAQNVTCTSNEDIDFEKVSKCLEMAGLKEKIGSLPNGVNTNMLKEFDDEGIVFSGGEMQKLMLARALYKDSPIIILDEPTAALDPIAENEMYEKYNSFIDNKTSIFISHRLSSTRFCHRILFMKDGKLIEDGTHDELMNLNGEYANMFEVQSHYYQKEVEDYAI